MGMCLYETQIDNNMPLDPTLAFHSSPNSSPILLPFFALFQFSMVTNPMLYGDIIKEKGSISLPRWSSPLILETSHIVSDLCRIWMFWWVLVTCPDVNQHCIDPVYEVELNINQSLGMCDFSSSPSEVSNKCQHLTSCAHFMFKPVEGYCLKWFYIKELHCQCLHMCVWEKNTYKELIIINLNLV